MQEPLFEYRKISVNSEYLNDYQGNNYQQLPPLEVKPNTTQSMGMNLDYSKIQLGSFSLIALSILYLLASFFVNQIFEPFSVDALPAMFAIAGLIGIMKSERKVLIVSLVIQILLILFHIIICGFGVYKFFKSQHKRRIEIEGIVLFILFGILSIGQIAVWLKYFKVVRSFS